MPSPPNTFAPSVKNLGSSYDDSTKGTQLVIDTSATGIDNVVSITYMLTSGGNASGDSIYEKDFTTKTVIVGSDQAVKIQDNQYLLFVEEDMTLAADDYLAICSCKGTNGTSPYSDPTTIFVTPKAPSAVAAKLVRSSSESYEDGELIVTIDKDETLEGKTINYFFVLQFQEVGQTGYSVVRIPTEAPETVEEEDGQLTISANVNALDQYGIVDDTLYVAVQAVRENGDEDGTTASSDLSDTLLATDDGVQQPPVNLKIDYQYYMGLNGITNVTFKRPPSWALITPTKFHIYKEVTDSEEEKVSRVIGTVIFKPNQESYLFVDEHANQELNPSHNPEDDYWLEKDLNNNDIITYWATSVGGEQEENESNPSNAESDIVSIPSSRPKDLSAVVSIENNDTLAPAYDGFTSLSLSFTSPAKLSGFTDNVYTVAYYLLEVTSSDGVIDYTSTEHDWLISDYPGENEEHTFNLRDGTLRECSENAELTIKLSAVTSRELAEGSPYVYGQIAEVKVKANSRPIITDINNYEGENEFSRDSLTSFTVYSYSTLVVPGVSLLIEDASGNYVVEKGAEMEVGEPTKVPEGYFRFAGAWEYKYDVPSAYTNTASKKILITAANASGFTQLKAKAIPEN